MTVLQNSAGLGELQNSAGLGELQSSRARCVDQQEARWGIGPWGLAGLGL